MYGRVYLVRCLINGKLYVGQTTQRLAARLRGHRRLTRARTSALGAAIRLYGAQHFTIEPLQECDDQASLNEAEIAWIAKLGTLSPNGYNLRAGGNQTPLSIASRLLLSKSKAGRTLSPEHRAAIAASSPRRKRIESERQAISAALTGRVMSPKWRAKLSAAASRRVPSDRQLAALAQHGRATPPDPLPGDRNPNARLTWPRVRAIRLLAAGFSQDELAHIAGVSQTAISRIIRHVSWKQSITVMLPGED